MLTPDQLSDIKNLQLLCEQAGGMILKLNDDLLKSQNRPESSDYFHYENGMLVGFLGLYGFGSQYEVCGMVHPTYRRTGIFTKLWNAAMASGSLDEAKSILLNAPKNSISAASWLKTIGCRYSFSEYEMKWQKDAALQLDDISETKISYRPFEPEDFATVAILYADGFDMKESDTRTVIDEEEHNDNRRRSMIVRRGETVGTIVLDYDTPGQSGIFGLVVDSAYRGQGIGRGILSQTIRRERECGQDIFISVETENEQALHLYKSLGFRSYTVQDYYELQR